MDMTLPYLIGECETLQSCGIDTEGLRKSLDGTKAVAHMQILSIEQFNAIRPILEIGIYSHEEVEKLMKTPEWSEEN